MPKEFGRESTTASSQFSDDLIEVTSPVDLVYQIHSKQKIQHYFTFRKSSEKRSNTMDQSARLKKELSVSCTKK